MKRVGRWVASHPGWVIGAIVVVTLFFGAFIPRIGYDADLGSMIPEGDPVIDQLQAASEDFGSESTLIVLFTTDDAFRPEALRQVDQVSRDLEGIRGVRSVISPLNM